VRRIFLFRSGVDFIELHNPLLPGSGIGPVKIVFSPPAFQLLYSAHARVNMMKEGLPWLLHMVVDL
jgi:hypothetical protein